MLAFVFCAITMKAVGRAAGAMVEEVRRQFREMPGIMERKTKPDYARCVEISTLAAQKEMIFPSLLAVFVPIITGLILGVPGCSWHACRRIGHWLFTRLYVKQCRWCLGQC